MNIKTDLTTVNKTENRADEINRVASYTILLNVILFVLKLFAGIFAHSTAMISDAIHTVSDVLSTVIVMIGNHISKKAADKSHNYGHEKFESIAGLFLGVLLFLTALWIFVSGIRSLLLAASGQLAATGMLALIAAVISIALKEWMYHFTVKVADRLNCTSLKADAWHHRSDALSSIGSLVGVAGSMMGLTFADPLAAIVIGILIIKVSFDIVKDAISQITDQAIDDELRKSLTDCVYEVKTVKDINLFKSRIHGSRIYVDLEIVVDKRLSIEEAHRISEEVHDRLEFRFPDIKHCMVHVHPSK